MSDADKLREWRRKNPERVAHHQKTEYQKRRADQLAYAREYNVRNREAIAARKKKYMQDMSEEDRAKHLETKRANSIMKRYGVTPDNYKAMLEAQGGTCALCPRTPEQERYNKLSIDHCHTTGKVRGLLCASCNHGLGKLGDSSEGLKRALDYIEGKNG
jgi:hypothetical protein